MPWWAWLIVIFVIFGLIGNSNDTKNQQKIREQNEEKKRREEAEQYILNSGDPEAIKLLMLARAAPANYRQIISGGAKKGNSVLRTALGVATGVVAGNAIAGAMAGNNLSDAMSDTPASFSDLSDSTEAPGIFDTPEEFASLNIDTPDIDAVDISDAVDTSDIGDAGGGFLDDFF